MSNIGLPNISIEFKGLGVSAIQRGSKGVAVLIVKDDTDQTFTTVEYRTITDFTSDEEAKYTDDNVIAIKDALEGIPSKLIVARMDIAGTLTDLLSILKGLVPMNCWFAIVSSTQTDHDTLTTFVKGAVANDRKRFKALVYNPAVAPDDMHVVNFTNPKVVFADSRGERTGDEAVAFLLGYLAGLPLTMSAIAKVLSKFKSVEEPADVETAVNSGEFVLMNDEGEVQVARGVNSLTTTGTGITDDMKFILIIEEMDLIYSDIYTTWKKFYKGKYKNHADNQALFIGALNAYFKELANSEILDINFENKTTVDIEAQRLVNIPKYGEEVVNGWSDDVAKEMTFGTLVYLMANIKPLNAMEDLAFDVYM